MKHIAKFLALGVFAAATTLSAHATPLAPGSVSITGGSGAISPDVLSASTTTLTFNANTFVVGPGLGSLGSLPGFETANFGTAPSTFTFSSLGATITPAEFLFSFAFNGGTETFDVSSVLLTGPSTFTFNGSVTDGIAADVTAAQFILTPTLTNGQPSGAFSGTLYVAPTPEPSSLILLGTGLASAAGIVFRKRRSVV